MKTGRLYVLLVLWCVFMFAPVTLGELGVFGPIGLYSQVSGGIIFLWIVGYLGQLAVFMWITSGVNQAESILRTLLWWLVASLMPWVIDWALPLVSPWLALPLFSIVIGIALWIAYVAGRAESLEEHGLRATGIVLEVVKPLMNVVVNEVYIKRKVRLRIEREDGAPAYAGTLNGLFMLGEIPSPGDRIPLLVDPVRPQRIEYDKGGGAGPETRRHASETLGEKLDRTEPGRAKLEGLRRRTTSSPGIAEELERLATLHDRGALTDSEFDAAKKKLLRS